MIFIHQLNPETSKSMDCNFIAKVTDVSEQAQLLTRWRDSALGPM